MLGGKEERSRFSLRVVQGNQLNLHDDLVMNYIGIGKKLNLSFLRVKPAWNSFKVSGLVRSARFARSARSARFAMTSTLK